MLTNLNRIVLSLHAHTVAQRDALMQREDGQALVEYTLIIALVSVAAILALSGLGAAIVTKLEAVTTDL